MSVIGKVTFANTHLEGLLPTRKVGRRFSTGISAGTGALDQRAVVAADWGTYLGRLTGSACAVSELPEAALLRAPGGRVVGSRQVAVSPAAQPSRHQPGSVDAGRVASPAPSLTSQRGLTGVHVQNLFTVWLRC